MKRQIALVGILVVAITLIAGIGTANAETTPIFKYAVTGGNFGTGHTVGFGFSGESKDLPNKGVIGKITIQYTQYVGDNVTIRTAASEGVNRSSSVLFPRKEGSVQLGLGGRLGNRKYAYFLLDIVAGATDGTTTAEYMSDRVWHDGFWEDNHWHEGYYEDKMAKEAFEDNRTYWGGGVGADVELYMTRNFAIEVEAVAGQTTTNTTLLKSYRKVSQARSNRSYYRGRVGFLVRF